MVDANIFWEEWGKNSIDTGNSGSGNQGGGSGDGGIEDDPLG